MYHSNRGFYTTVSFKGLITPIILSVVLCWFHCKSNAVFIHLKPELPESELAKDSSGISVKLSLSSNSLIDNSLTINNSLKKSITVYPEDIILEIPERDIKMNAVSDYPFFVNNRLHQAKSLCAQSNKPYQCTDKISEFYENLIGKGYSYGAIKPGKSSQGYITFNIPLPVTEPLLLKKISTDKKQSAVNGTISITVYRENADRITFDFPVTVGIENNYKKLPYRLSTYY